MDFLLFCTWKAKRTEVKMTKVELNWSEVKISSWSVFFRQIRQTKWFNFFIFTPFLNAYQTIKQSKKQSIENLENALKQKGLYCCGGDFILKMSFETLL